MNDFVHPGFRALSRKGKIFNSPMSRVRNTFTYSATGYEHQYANADCATYQWGTWKDSYTNLLAWRAGALSLATPGSSLPTDELVTDVATRCRAGIKDPNVQGMVFVAELRQTLSMLRNPIRAATDLLQRGKGVNGKDVGGAAGSQYLTYVFGLRPLMLDIEGIIDALVQRTYDRETSRAYASDSLDSTSNVLLHQGSLMTAYMEYTLNEKVEVRAGTLYAFSGRSMSDNLGVSLRDIPAAAWELLPWSFVVDWFTNVGHLISALTASCTNEILAEWVSTKTTVTVTRRVSSTVLVPGSGWVINRQCGDRDMAVYETYSREPANLGGLMGLTFNFTLDRTPILSAISLLLQQLALRQPKGR
jgi:hypothetical protein